MVNNTEQPTISTNNDKMVRKVYETPVLQRFGTIDELTKGNVIGGADVVVIGVSGIPGG